MSKIITVLCCIAFMALAFIDVAGFVTNARNGLILVGNNVVPVLFPFFFVSGLLVELDLFKRKGLQKIGVVGMSFLAGYPTGARMLSQLYMRGEISRAQAIKMAAYTSTCSPIFIIATLGAALYQDVRLGMIIFTAHILGALFNGIVLNRVSSLVSVGLNEEMRTPAGRGRAQAVRGFRIDEFKPTDTSEAVSRALYSAVQNILAVGGLILVFFVASASLPLPIASAMEMTTGVFHAEQVLSGVWRAIVPCAIVSFGGFCVAMQGFVFLKSFKMPVWFYLLYKVTHMIFAIVFCVIIYFATVA
jgi:hypothetical protein